MVYTFGKLGFKKEEVDTSGGTIENPIPNIGALIIRIAFWCILYYNYSKEPPK